MRTSSPAVAVGARVAGWALFAAVVAAAGAPSLRSPPRGPAFALVLGALGGAALYAVLARGVARVPGAGTLAPSRVVARAAYVASRAAYEEALWRGTFLARLAGAVGAAPAFVVTTVAFAAAHARAQGRRALAQLATGSVFASVYLATGRLGAAITAHATYNVLVGVSLPADGDTAHEAPPAEAAAVAKRFGEREALRGVSLRAERGQVLALVGANGAGKTTLITTLVGLRRPDAGRVTVCGRDPRRPRTRLSLGFTPQEAAFPPTLRVREVVELVGAHFPHPLPTREVLDRFALGGLAERQTGGLSGGERRRVAVALAFVGRPRVVFLDEPTVGLDLEARRAVRAELRRFIAGGGAVLLTSHDLHELETLAQRVAVLRRGKVVADGSLDEIRRRAGVTRVSFEARGVPPLPGVAEHARAGDLHRFVTREPEELVAALVRSGVPFSRLEVAPLALEDAFGELMGGEP